MKNKKFIIILGIIILAVGYFVLNQEDQFIQEEVKKDLCENVIKEIRHSDDDFRDWETPEGGWLVMDGVYSGTDNSPAFAPVELNGNYGAWISFQFTGADEEKEFSLIFNVDDTSSDYCEIKNLVDNHEVELNCYGKNQPLFYLDKEKSIAHKPETWAQTFYKDRNYQIILDVTETRISYYVEHDKVFQLWLNEPLQNHRFGFKAGSDSVAQVNHAVIQQKSSQDAIIIERESNSKICKGAEWCKILGGVEKDEGLIVYQLIDGFIVLGKKDSVCYGAEEGLFIKTDFNGDKQWEDTLDNLCEIKPASHHARKVDGEHFSTTKDGGYVVVGEDGQDFWISKFDYKERLEWEETYEYECYSNMRFIEQTQDGGYVAVGESGCGIRDIPSVVLFKINSKGKKEWDKEFAGESSAIGANTVRQTNDGGYIFSGHTNATDAFGNEGWVAWLVKTNNEGDLQWEKKYINEDEYESELINAVSVNQTFDGGYIFIEDSGILVKTDQQGEIEWKKEYGNFLANSLLLTEDGNYVVVGQTFSGDKRDLWVMKVSQNGDKVWEKTFKNGDYNEGFSISQTYDGGYIITGITKENDLSLDSDIWLIKLGSDSGEVFKKNDKLSTPEKSLNYVISRAKENDEVEFISSFDSEIKNKESAIKYFSTINDYEIISHTLDKNIAGLQLRFLEKENDLNILREDWINFKFLNGNWLILSDSIESYLERNSAASSTEITAIDIDEIKTKINDFIKNKLDKNANVEEIVEKSGLYKLTIRTSGSVEVNSYVTKNLKLFFSGVEEVDFSLENFDIDSVENLLLDHLANNYVNGQDITMKWFSKEGGLYKGILVIDNGVEQTVYLTEDGTKIFRSVMDIE